MEAAAGKQRADDVRERERVNVGGVDFFQMVGAGRVHLDGEARCAGVRKLLGVDARDQATGASGGENFARLRDGERAAIAEDIAEFGQACQGDRRNPALDEQIDVRFGAAAKFRGDNMRAEKCGDDVERMFLVKLGEQRKNFQFTFPVQAVAAFGFDRGGAVGCENSGWRWRVF